MKNPSFIYFPVLLITTAFALTSCGTLGEGLTQTVTIATRDIEGAACTVTAPEGKVYKIASTPATLTFPRYHGKLHVICSHPGYKTGHVTVTDKMSEGMKRNVITGGFGAMIDFANRADRAYPSEIIVWMEPSFWRNDLERDQWMAKKRAAEQEKRDASRKCLFSEFNNC